tara:strand:- start:626 stop:1588 length:963 start_codon:yes stop_codon:yes gene_type:complete
MEDVLKDLIKQFMPFAQKHIGFKKPPRLFLKKDHANAENPLGKTAYYEPGNMSITLYVTGRHPKDILRSLGHELVHHKQNCNGKFKNSGDTGAGYAQKDPHLRRMEQEANRDGSMCLRDFEDSLKKNDTIYYEHLQKGDKKMSFNDWKEKEIGTLLSEAWGFKFNTLEEFDEFNGKGELQAESEEEITQEAAEEDAGETVEESADAEELEEAADAEELDEAHCAGNRDDDEEKLEEGEDDIEELAQAKGAKDRRKPHKSAKYKDKDEDLDERRARSRKTAANAQGRHDDERARLPEAKIREILKKAIQIVNENNKAAKKD